MTDQLGIDFATTHARKRDPQTSKDAAKAAEKFANTHSGRVLACLLTFGPMTVDQIAKITGLQSQQVNKRLPDLERAEMALPTALTAKSNSGRDERLWVANGS